MNRTAALLAGLIIIGFAFLVRAQPTSAASDGQSSRVTGSSTLQTQAHSVSGAIVPVPIPIPSPEAVRFYQSGNALWIVSTLWGFLVPALILFTGFSARLRDWAKRIGHYWYFVVVLYFAFFTLTMFAANLSLDFYSDFMRPHAYGLSSQTFGKWLHDELISLG